jgi:Competence-damaged protein
MAKGVARRMRAHVAVATTGYADPDPLNGVRTPFAYCAVWTKSHSRVVRVEVRNLDRQGVQQRVASRAVALLAETLRLLVGTRRLAERTAFNRKPVQTKTSIASDQKGGASLAESDRTRSS